MTIYTYTIPLDQNGNPRTDIIIRNEDAANIPLDPANSDYQAYLATLAANSATPQAQICQPSPLKV